jgi:hypothetical protein
MELEGELFTWQGEDAFSKNELTRAVSKVFMTAGDTTSAIAVWRAREVMCRSMVEDNGLSLPAPEILSRDVFDPDKSVAPWTPTDYAELLSGLAQSPKTKVANELFLSHGRAGAGLISNDVIFGNSLTKINYRTGRDTESVEVSRRRASRAHARVSGSNTPTPTPTALSFLCERSGRRRRFARQQPLSPARARQQPHSPARARQHPHSPAHARQHPHSQAHARQHPHSPAHAPLASLSQRA